MNPYTNSLDILADRDIIRHVSTQLPPIADRAGGGQMAGRLRKEGKKGERANPTGGMFLLSFFTSGTACVERTFVV